MYVPSVDQCTEKVKTYNCIAQQLNYKDIFYQNIASHACVSYYWEIDIIY